MNNRHNINPLIEIAIDDELKTSIKLIEAGFGALQEINFVNDFYFSPFQSLSQGIERLLKVYICVGHFNKYQLYPTYEYMKKLKHDLLLMRDKIINEFFLADRKILIEDLNFLKKNQDLKDLMKILSIFGDSGKYYNLDVITNSEKERIDPKLEWEKLEIKLKKRIDFESQSFETWNFYHDDSGQIIRFIIMVFEKFMATVARQFSFGALGSDGKSLSVNMCNYLHLDKGSFGIKYYGLKKSEPIKRDLVEKRFLYPAKIINEKVIKRKEFVGKWPFFTNQVIVQKRDNHWYTIVIDEYIFALNGYTKNRFKLEDPHEAGFAIIGIVISPFLSIAKDLK